ncbi:universal stress protein [Haloarchaeobius sp. DFWS5]|uniref:universal stress protein n=1 Tax=Haloarchaeobius sp. DFWS5 TaxID=3446114 RepID=UPI003EC08F6C
MTFVVPYDDGPLSRAALDRAVALSEPLDEDVLVVTVVPNSDAYASDHGWLDADTPFSIEAAAESLRTAVASLAPDASFQYVRTGASPSPGTIATKLRQVARDADASVVFVGSDDAGRLVSSLGSVGSTVAADDEYDVYIVRHPLERTD